MGRPASSGPFYARQKARQAENMPMTIPEIRQRLRAADAGELAALERSLAADERKGVRQALEQARRRVAAEQAEMARIEALYTLQASLLPEGGVLAVGLDEVGRGAVAGPLAVGAVVLPAEPHIAGLNDSKQLRPERRTELAVRIEEVALGWAVAYVAPADIDRDGMTASLRRAFVDALAQVEAGGLHADAVLLDGNPLHLDEREVNVVKGDAKCACIAAASIVAKVHRDRLMCELAAGYPAYDLDVNKGYASPDHIAAIRSQGLSEIHRASFCKSFMQETLF